MLMVRSVRRIFSWNVRNVVVFRVPADSDKWDNGSLYAVGASRAKEEPMADLATLISVDAVSLGVVADDWNYQDRKSVV